ncbi:MAG: Mrp/NBP35 family ATP-binding protein [Chthonomonas sp.]|nr:Mrp/NBP35 family ATP-binding protein [Chthonomonas sp.]
MITEAQVLDALRTVQDPDLHQDIVRLGFVKDVQIKDGSVKFQVQLTTPACPVKDILKAQCEEAVIALAGVEKVEVEMTAQVRSRATEQEDLVPEVKQIIAIASGKGGVGKSTVSANLAVALAQSGARVGLLDADVYGPSIPLMLGCQDEHPFTRGKKIVPIERHGIRIMSIGFLLEEGQAVMWRGPMVAGTVKQLLADVDWGDLDYLLVDLPPGTGDAPMSLAQLVPLTGVVIVSTPQTVAGNIAGKAAKLFTRMNTPLMGVIENMASFIAPDTGKEYRLFSGMPGSQLAAELKVPFLGSIPLDPEVGLAGDRGLPSVLSAPDSAQAKAFMAISKDLAAQASVLALARRESESQTPTFSPA